MNQPPHPTSPQQNQPTDDALSPAADSLGPDMPQSDQGEMQTSELVPAPSPAAGHRAEQADYRTIFDNADDGIFVYDPVSEKIVDVNTAGCRMFGYAADEMIGLNVRTLSMTQYPYRPEDIVGWVRKVAKEGPQIFEWLARSRDGGKIWVELHLKRIRMRDQERILAIVRDISERKLVEEKLAREKAFSDFAIDTMPGIFYMFTEDGRFLRWNKNFETVSGYNSTEIAAMAPSDFFLGDEIDYIRNQIQKAFQSGQATAEAHFISKDGRGTPYLFTGIRIEDEGRPHLIGMGVDISDRKKAEKEKVELERQLQHAMKIEAIGTLAGGIAHDFNNILGAIMGYTELGRFEAPKDSVLDTYLLQVLKASQRAKSLVEQILIFSRQGEIQPRPLMLKPIIEEVLKLLRASIPATIAINANISKNSGPVMADPTQIHQVLMNLCTNAAHSMLAKGGMLSIGLQNTTLSPKDPILVSHPDLKPGPFLNLMVSDTGHGIDPLILHRIFEPYFTTKEKGEGTGLGLSAVHGIVQRCGGAITVESQMGKGTSFYVLLPLVSLEIEESPAAIPLTQGKRERVLLVDDEPMLADLGHKMIERLGYQVVAKTSSREALECFQENPDGFDILITDQTMPLFTGEELARECLRLRPQIPIIICTGYSERIDHQKALEMGISKLLAKPVIMTELAEAIRQALNK